MARDQVTFSRPVPAKLFVRLENGEEWEARPDDLDRFGYGRRLDLYTRTQKMLAEGLGITDDITDHDGPNLIRYLIECGIMYDHSPWADENGDPWAEDGEGDEPPYKERLQALFSTAESTP